jgi:hypothetical protein
MTPQKRAAFRCLGALASILAGLAASEMTLRMLHIGYGNAPLVSDPILNHIHPKNYEFRSHTPSGEYGGFVVKYDAEGLVVDPNEHRPSNAPTAYRWAFMGDSCVEAGQVPYRESFVGRLNTALQGNAIVRNYGVSSYSPSLYWLQWQHQVKLFHPTHVFVLLYSNDIGDDRNYTSQGQFDSSGRLVAVPGPGGGRVVAFLREFYTVRLARKAQLRLEWLLRNRHTRVLTDSRFAEEEPGLTHLSCGFVRDLADSAKQAGATFVLMVVPSKYRLLHQADHLLGPEFSDSWKAWAKQEHIRFIDLVPAFRAEYNRGRRLFYTVDIHFNSDGHKIVTQEICRSFPGVCEP